MNKRHSVFSFFFVKHPLEEFRTFKHLQESTVQMHLTNTQLTIMIYMIIVLLKFRL